MAGVRSGQRRREAQGCCPELVVLDHDPARDARQFEAVIRAVAELSPRLDVIEPGWLCLAARGPSRYYGGDAALAARLTALVTGVLDSRGLASAARRRRRRRRACRRQPIAARRAGSNAGGGRTRGVGVLPGAAHGGLAARCRRCHARVGRALHPPRAAHPRRPRRPPGRRRVRAHSEAPGCTSHRLAGGGDDRPPGTTDPPAEWRTERAFDEPVAHLETVVFVAKQLADELVATLAGEGRVCTRVVVTAETEHGERSERAWYRAVGLSSSAIVERVRWQLEGWVAQPGALSGGIALLRLVPDQVRGDDGDQLGLWGGRSQADHDALRAVTRLSGLFGEQAVCVPRGAAGGPGRALPVGTGGDRRSRGSGRPAGGG